MKKIFLYAVFILLVITPINIFAYDFTCDSGQYKQGDSFYCRITDTERKNYSMISGSLTINNKLLSCSVDSVSLGLTNTSIKPEEFNLEGVNETNTILTFKCSVLGTEVSEKEQIVIENFKTQVNYGDIFEEILRSSYISIINIPTTTKVVTNSKPRDTSDSNSLLTSITEKNLDFSNFSRFVTEYNFQVLNNVSKLEFSYETLNPSATVEIKGKTDLSVGDNVIDLYVTTPEGETKTCYTINVKRLKKGEKVYIKESDANLAKLNVKTYKIDFDKDVYDYTIKLPSSINRIEINAQPNVLDANVEISSTSNLVNGSIVIIKVTSKDKSNTKEYKIHILEDKEKKDYSSYIYLIIFTILIIGIIVLIIRTMRKNREDPLLSAKINKRKINKGTKTNRELVPEVNSINNSPEVINNNQTNNIINNSTLDNTVISEELKNFENKSTNIESNINSTQTDLSISNSNQTNISTNPTTIQQPLVVETRENIAPEISESQNPIQNEEPHVVIPQTINNDIPEQSLNNENIIQNENNDISNQNSIGNINEIPILTNNEENLNDTIKIQPIQNLNANNISNELAASNQITADMINDINSNNNQ